MSRFLAIKKATTNSQRKFLTELANISFETYSDALRKWRRLGSISAEAGSGPVDRSEYINFLMDAAIRQGATDIDWNPARRFHASYGHMLPPIPDKVRKQPPGFPEDVPVIFIHTLKARLRATWRAPDQRSKLYGVYWIMRMFVPIPKNSWETLLQNNDYFTPEPSPFEEALLNLINDSDLAKVCGNPDCPAPYFFATRPNQKYCTLECAKPAMRRAKLRYWNKVGKKNRAKQLKEERAKSYVKKRRHLQKER